MKHILKIISAIFIILIVATVHCNAKDKLYTAYNVWKWSGYNNAFINFKGGRTMIPAGTEIKNQPAIIDNQPANNNTLHPQNVSFRTLSDNRRHRIHFILRYHPKKTIKDYMNYTFTTKNFEELTSGMTQTEIDAIKKGEIVDGMSKEAVLVCYGYPTERTTRSLDKNVWVYWMNSRTITKVSFNSKNRTGPEISQPETKYQDVTTGFEEKLLLLKRLLKQDLITQEEYDNKKAALLEDL
ncbi:MAG: hypothetical protein K8R67_13080 [Desulfobacteraceae bacterium]|nr:hypothetical protein [Desulfobacteraceae bacterium]